jgi:hypothetical protein
MMKFPIYGTNKMHVPNHQLDIVVVHELFPPGFMAGIFEVKTMDFPAAKPTHSIQIEFYPLNQTQLLID